MLTILLLILFLGIITGLIFAAILALCLIKVKCPTCKKAQPLKEIIIFSWKDRTITGQPCLKCQKPKIQITL